MRLLGVRHDDRGGQNRRQGSRRGDRRDCCRQGVPGLEGGRADKGKALSALVDRQAHDDQLVADILERFFVKPEFLAQPPIADPLPQAQQPCDAGQGLRECCDGAPFSETRIPWMDGPDSRTDRHSITLSHMDITGRQIWRTGIQPSPSPARLRCRRTLLAAYAKTPDKRSGFFSKERRLRSRTGSAATRGWDYIVVGAGAAGCVVAGRLSQTMPDVRIALIEAGGVRLGLTTKIPGTAFIASASPRRNWNFETEPVPPRRQRCRGMRCEVSGG